MFYSKLVFKLVFLGVLSTGILSSASACINAYGEEVIDMKPFDDPKYIQKSLKIAIDAYNKTPNYEHGIDFAVMLIKSKSYQKALNVLYFLEKKYPKRYATASNIGTTYELIGQLHESYQWIKEGIRRNPDSHEGTEWLHLEILKAKIALKKDKNWLKHHNIAGLDFKNNALPQKPDTLPVNHLGKVQTLKKLDIAFRYQLSERLNFIEAPDPSTSELLRLWADIVYVKDGGDELLSSIRIYWKAKEFGSPKLDLLNRRIEKMNQLQTQEYKK